jgi:hypothetical protein
MFNLLIGLDIVFSLGTVDGPIVCDISNLYNMSS